MALSTKAKRRLEVAMARRQEAEEVIAAIEAGANEPAAAVADIADQVLLRMNDILILCWTCVWKSRIIGTTNEAVITSSNNGTRTVVNKNSANLSLRVV